MTTNEILWIKAQEACDWECGDEKVGCFFMCVHGVKINKEIDEHIWFDLARGNGISLSAWIDNRPLSVVEYNRAKSIYCLLLIESAGKTKNRGRRLKKKVE